MSEEIRTADANLQALHAERAALRLAAQTAGIVVWLDGDTYHASLNDAEATGATLGAAIVALALGVHAVERARVEGYARGHGDGLAEGRAAERLEHERRVRRAV